MSDKAFRIKKGASIASAGTRTLEVVTSVTSTPGVTDYDGAEVAAVLNSNVSTTNGSPATDPRLLSFGGWSNGLAMIRNPAGGGIGIFPSNQPTNGLRLTSAGNLGVGTLTPSQYQHGGTSKVLEIYNSDTAANGQAHIMLSSGQTGATSGSIGTISWALPSSTASMKGMAYIGASIGTNSTAAAPSAALTFATRNTSDSTFVERMRIVENGYVGMGTTSPQAALHVSNGSIVNLMLDGHSGAWVGSDFVINRSATLGNAAGQMPWIQMQATDSQYAGGNAVGIGAYANETQFWRYVQGAWVKSAGIAGSGQMYIGSAQYNSSSRLISDGSILVTADAASAPSGFCGADPADKFTTDTDKVISHYGLTWKMFSDNNGGNQAALSGYGGIRMFTSGQLRLWINANGHTVPGANASYDLGSPSLPWRQVYSAGFKAAKALPGGGDGTTIGYSFGTDGDTGLFSTVGSGTWGVSGSEFYFYSDGAVLSRHTATYMIPGSDNSIMCGHPSYRWTTVYAVTGSINTSDAEQKTEILDLDQAELNVAKKIKSGIKKFKFKDSVAQKGSDGARIHVGVIAQEVRDAFISEGLDPTRYSLFCSDTWYESFEDRTFTRDDGTSYTKQEKVTSDVPVDGYVEVTRLGIRYEELLAFVIAAM